MVDVGISSRFMAMALNVGNSSDYLESSKSGMAESQMNISQDKLKATPICLPPVEEQEEIVKRVDELLSFCRALRSAIPKANAMARSLADSLTAKIH